MKIDVHVHLYRFDAQNRYLDWTRGQPVLQQDHLLDELTPAFKRYGMKGIIAVQAQETRHETIWLLKQAAKDDRILGVVGYLDPAAPDAEEQIDSLSHPKLVALRNVAQGQRPGYLVRPAFIRGVEECARAGLIFELLIFPEQLREAAELVASCPEVRFVLDHIAKPRIREGLLQPWTDDLRALAAYENVVGVKLSGMVTEATAEQRKLSHFRPYMMHALEAFGVDRMMFGSDHPVCRIWGSYDETIELVLAFLDELDRSSAEKVLGGNARQIYNL